MNYKFGVRIYGITSMLFALMLYPTGFLLKYIFWLGALWNYIMPKEMSNQTLYFLIIGTLILLSLYFWLFYITFHTLSRHLELIIKSKKE